MSGLRRCRQCGKDMSPQAEVCGNCGGAMYSAVPGMVGCFVVPLGIVLLIWLLIWWLSS